MNLKHSLKWLLLTGMIAVPTLAQDAHDSSPHPLSASDRRVSYALGMKLGLQIKQTGVDVDVDRIAKGLADVLAGKRTEIAESEMDPLFIQSQAYGLARKAGQNEKEGAAFLAKNATDKTVVVLPDGLQYRIIRAGTGEMAKSGDLLDCNIRGRWINGEEFLNRHDVWLTMDKCPAGIHEALNLMKAGSTWQIFVPSKLAYGDRPGKAAGFGSTLVYELEFVSARQSTAAQPDSAENLRSMDALEFLPSKLNSPQSQTPANPNPTAPKDATPALVLPPAADK
jgi:FKBP-type peptidyl-prolyl cis-trans isomerase FklB